MPNTQCYQEDMNHKTSSPNGCQKYLHCNPSDCMWRQNQCSQSQYWNNAKKQCVQSPQQATCGAAIFGRSAKVHVVNAYYDEKVLDDCRGCQTVNSWTDQSALIGYERLPEQAWNQVLIAKRRGDDEFYSLAFDKRENGQVKVIADVGSSKPVAKMYNPSHSSPAQWKFAPVQGQRNTYQIISTTSNQALAMNKVEGQKEYLVHLVQPDQQDKKQYWQFQDAETQEVLSASQHSSHQDSSDF